MHSTRLALTLAVAAALGPIVPAQAGTYSSPLLTASGGGMAQCRVSNVGTAPIKVTGTLYNSSGTALAPLGNSCVDLYGGVLPAGVTCSLITGLGTVRCVVDASSSKVRVVLVLLDSGGDIVASEPATKK